MTFNKARLDFYQSVNDNGEIEYCMRVDITGYDPEYKAEHINDIYNICEQMFKYSYQGLAICEMRFGCDYANDIIRMLREAPWSCKDWQFIKSY